MGPLQSEHHADLSSVRLSQFGLRREAPRPPDDRQAGYDALFDHDTLFYDVFRSADGAGVICLGPPLLNCEEHLAEAAFCLGDTDIRLARSYRPPRTPYQPSCQFHLSGPDLAAAGAITLDLAGRRLRIPVRGSGCALFAGRRVATTMSKDNPLEWIRDWAAFNIRIHGADAIIIYDNGSTAYDLSTLRKSLEDLEGLDVLLIVRWDFPYGPGVGKRNVQDSFYCQPGALDHARRRHCSAARAVLNADIDELVVGPRGASVFEEAERSRRAAYLFPGVWVQKTGDNRSSQAIRHTDCLYRRRDQLFWQAIGRYDRLLRTKWVAIPGLCDDTMEWGVHDIYATDSSTDESTWKVLSRKFAYRHFRQVTIGPHRSRKLVKRRSPLRDVFDWRLAAAFARAFPGRLPRRGLCRWARR